MVWEDGGREAPSYPIICCSGVAGWFGPFPVWPPPQSSPPLESSQVAPIKKKIEQTTNPKTANDFIVVPPDIHEKAG